MDYNDVYREDAELCLSLVGNTKQMDAIEVLEHLIVWRFLTI